VLNAPTGIPIGRGPYVKPQSYDYRDLRSGKMLFQASLGDEAATRYGAPTARIATSSPSLRSTMVALAEICTILQPYLDVISVLRHCDDAGIEPRASNRLASAGTTLERIFTKSARWMLYVGVEKHRSGRDELSRRYCAGTPALDRILPRLLIHAGAAVFASESVDRKCAAGRARAASLTRC
jgi:hypothetical protein